MSTYRGHQKNQQRWTLGWGSLLGVILLLGIFALVYADMGRSIYGQWFGRGYQSTIAIVTRGEKTSPLPIQVHYRFTVDESIYHGTGWLKTSGSARMGALGLSYPVPKQIPVHYNPQNPTDNYIDLSFQPLSGKYIASPCIGGCVIPLLLLSTVYCLLAAFIPSWRLDS